MRAKIHRKKEKEKIKKKKNGRRKFSPCMGLPSTEMMVWPMRRPAASNAVPLPWWCSAAKKIRENRENLFFLND